MCFNFVSNCPLKHFYGDCNLFSNDPEKKKKEAYIERRQTGKSGKCEKLPNPDERYLGIHCTTFLTIAYVRKISK